MNPEIVIHAVPERMWYVEGFLIPWLESQGADRIRVWCDEVHAGNLAACMDAFAAMEGDGGAWHIQDDVLPRRDFMRTCREFDSGVVYGFCCEYFTDDPDLAGTMYAEDAWHSFQCVRIPHAWARDCAAWFYSGDWRKLADPQLDVLWPDNKGDDAFFRAWLLAEHGDCTVVNLKPNLVEHVDWLIGGSVLSQWRDYFARASWFDEPETLQFLRDWLADNRPKR